MLCSPITDSTTPMNMLLRLSVTGPIVIGPKLNGSVSSRPSVSITLPGLNKKNSAPWMNMARRLIQAAWNGENQPERLWWDSRPSRSLRKVTGTSTVFSPIRTDFSTISEAYSHDCDTRPMRSSASRVMPRMPQWISLKRLPNRTFRAQVVIGVPKYWWSLGIAPGSIEPCHREPIAYSLPARSASTNRPTLRKS